MLVGYCQANTYIQGFRHFGYGDILEEVHHHWKAGDRPRAEAAISERMIEELYVFSTADECRAHIERFRDAGIQLPVVAVPPSSRMPEDAFARLVDTFAQ